MSSLTDENGDLRKQIGCMNGIFQLFDRHHFLTARRMSSHNHKRRLQGAQPPLDPQYAKNTVTEKRQEVQKEKPRISTESSRASYSSSSCSSTFSSLDCNRIVQPETLRQTNIPESPFQTTAMKEQQPSLSKGTQPLDLRDVVKDSMYREARGLPIKSMASDEKRGTVMKHIDSPRPSLSSKFVKAKATVYEGTTKNSKDERQLAIPPRFSYDGRESQEIFKSAMKYKEVPRLSLDSKASSMKYSALESRLNFLNMENESSSQIIPLNQEPGSHSRTSSIVAKLMGLEILPDDESMTPTIKSCPKETSFLKLTSTAEQGQVSCSPRVSQNSPASPSPRSQSPSFVRKTTSSSKFPLEPAPWRQQDSGQGSPRMTSQSRKAPTSTPYLSSSVYGQIEKRIKELEFKKSGKDLRALKQILEAMQKTRERLEGPRGESAEEKRSSLQDSCSNQNPDLSMWKNSESYNQIPTTKGICMPKQLGSSVVIIKPAKIINKVKFPVPTQAPTMEVSNLPRLQTRDPKYRRGNSAHMQKATDVTPKNNNLKDQRFPSSDPKTTWRTSEQDRTSAGPQCMKVNRTTPGRSFGVVSPRLQQNLPRIGGQSHPTTPSSDSGRVKKHCSKKLIENSPQNRKYKVKAKDLQLSDDQLSERSSETGYSSYQGDAASVKSESNNSLVSQTETEVISLARSINTNAVQKENLVSTTREHIPAVEIAVTMLEQPSPISVLDDAFYSEDSPSPVKKISTAFRENESTSPDEVEWHLENLHHSTDRTRSNHICKYNQKLDNMKHPVHELRLFNNEPDESAANSNVSVHGSLNPDHIYIKKILMTSGLLKGSSFISTTDRLLSSHHLINPDMFHVLEQTEEIMEGLGEELQKNDRTKLNKKTRRKIIFDMVDEILVHKITTGGLFTVEKKRTSPQGLLKEVYSEIDRRCRIPDSNLDDEEDEMTRLLTADVMSQSEDWAGFSGEVPAMVLDIERLIFKDLINEVLTGEVMGLHSWPKRHCRQLFNK